MSRRLPFVSAVFAVVGLTTHAGLAAENVPLGPVVSPRIEIGTTFGIVGERSFEINGQKAGTEELDSGGQGTAGVSISYAQGILPYFGAIVVGRCGSEQSGWSEQRGERRARCDLALGPELWLFPKGKKLPQIDMHFAIPVGATWSFIHSDYPLGVKETYSTGTGWTWSVVLGTDAFWGHHGAYLDLAVVQHYTWFTHTSTLVSDPRVHSTDRYYFDQPSLVLGLGYAFRFF